MKFALVDVSITHLDDSTVGFTTRGEDDKPHPFSCGIGEVWLECPSTAQQAGDRGGLYISTTGLAARSRKDGKTRIKGTTPDSTGKVQVSIKWPDHAGDLEPVAQLEIWPTNIIVEGYAHGDPAFHGSVSLVDPRYSSTSQAIRFDNGGMITLALTDDGFHRFSLAMPDAGGAPASGPSPGANGHLVASPPPAPPQPVAAPASPWDQLVQSLAAAIAERLAAALGSSVPAAPRNGVAPGAHPGQLEALKRDLDRMAKELHELKARNAS